MAALWSAANVGGMRYSSKFIATLVVVMLLIAALLSGTVRATSARAQATAPVHQRLVAGFALEEAGHPAAAIAAAQALLDDSTLAPFDRAQALDLEGISYEDMDEPEKAVHALEE